VKLKTKIGVRLLKMQLWALKKKIERSQYPELDAALDIYTDADIDPKIKAKVDELFNQMLRVQA
jgi:hypothetical protein